MTVAATLAASRPWEPWCDRVAAAAARGYYWPGADHDDVLQEARIGVAKALRDYRPELGAPLVGFAHICARRQVITALKTATRVKCRSLNDSASIEGKDLDGVLTCDHDDPAVVVELRDDVRNALGRLSTLSPLEREAVERVAIQGERYEDVGPYKSVDNALQRARRKLRLPAAA